MIIVPRLARKDLKTSFLHVIIQGVNKAYIFEDEEHIKEYLGIMSKKIKDYKIEIMAYCIMNNHAHFLVYTEDVEELGKFMQKVNLIYAQKYNREKKRVGVLFRNRYQTEPIYNNKYLINCIKYIHDNPVKAKIVTKSEEYKYSSYKDYMNNIGVTQSKIMKELFGSNCDYRQLFKEACERRFIEAEDESDKAIKEYIEGGIREYEKENAKDIGEIYYNRETLKSLIKFLKEDCGIKYVEIRNYFDIPRGTMDSLKT